MKGPVSTRLEDSLAFVELVLLEYTVREVLFHAFCNRDFWRIIRMVFRKPIHLFISYSDFSTGKYSYWSVHYDLNIVVSILFQISMSVIVIPVKMVEPVKTL
jgi:hypothetical protein